MKRPKHKLDENHTKFQSRYLQNYENSVVSSDFHCFHNKLQYLLDNRTIHKFAMIKACNRNVLNIFRHDVSDAVRVRCGF